MNTAEYKFEPGDSVWFMFENKPIEEVIEHLIIRVNPGHNYIEYIFKLHGKNFFSKKPCDWQAFEESEVFATKEELIKTL